MLGFSEQLRRSLCSRVCARLVHGDLPLPLVDHDLHLERLSELLLHGAPLLLFDFRVVVSLAGPLAQLLQLLLPQRFFPVFLRLRLRARELDVRQVVPPVRFFPLLLLLLVPLLLGLKLLLESLVELLVFLVSPRSPWLPRFSSCG